MHVIYVDDEQPALDNFRFTVATEASMKAATVSEARIFTSTLTIHMPVYMVAPAIHMAVMVLKWRNMQASACAMAEDMSAAVTVV